MGYKNKSVKHYVRSYEFVGDGFLNFYAKYLLTKRFSSSELSAWSHVFGKIIKNDSLTEFGRKFSYGNANAVEILIGQWVSDGKIEKAKNLIEKLFEYIINKNSSKLNKYLKDMNNIPTYSFERLCKKNYSLNMSFLKSVSEYDLSINYPVNRDGLTVTN